MTLCLKGGYIEAVGGGGGSKRDHNRPNLALLGAIRKIICKAGLLWKVNKDKILFKHTVGLTLLKCLLITHNNYYYLLKFWKSVFICNSFTFWIFIVVFIWAYHTLYCCFDFVSHWQQCWCWKLLSFKNCKVLNLYFTAVLSLSCLFCYIDCIILWCNGISEPPDEEEGFIEIVQVEVQLICDTPFKVFSEIYSGGLFS